MFINLSSPSHSSATHATQPILDCLNWGQTILNSSKQTIETSTQVIINRYYLVNTFYLSLRFQSFPIKLYDTSLRWCMFLLIQISSEKGKHFKIFLRISNAQRKYSHQFYLRTFETSYPRYFINWKKSGLIWPYLQKLVIVVWNPC